MNPLDKFHIVVVTGDRHWNIGVTTPIRRQLVRRWNKHGSNLLVISGEAPGVDTVARMVCHEEGFWFIGIPAPWNRRGWYRAAGPKRNTFMLEMFPVNEVLAFHDAIETSTGTKNCVEQANRLGIRVKGPYGSDGRKTA